MSTRLKNRMGDELERLIKAIGDCKSKSEEDRIVYRAMESTKASVKSGKVDKQRTRDFLIKLLYFEMLGHDASFGHFLAVQACGSSSVMTKLVGYLAVAQFLDSSDSLILLLVNTWRSDLQNDNHLIVCAALTAVCKLVNGDAIGPLVQQVISLTSHSKEGVRKKAVMALHRFCQIDPLAEGGMEGIDANSIFRKTLCDKDPAVMAATLCAVYELAKHDPYPHRNLIPSLSSIIKQVIERRLSKTYEYHHSPAPFIQIRLLRIMALLGEGDKPSTDNMRHVLLSVIKNASPRNTIGFAILFECIRTITTISPDTTLLEAAAKAIFSFFRGDNSHNLKYMGLDALGGIVSINFRQAQEHQAAVMDCLEDPDDTLKLKTLELLYKMTKASNVEIVVEKLIQYLCTCSDEHVTNNICERVSDLAERYAPSTLWYVETMFEMFEAAGDATPINARHNLMKLVAEQEVDLHRAVVEICLSLIEKPKMPKPLLQVVCWVLGEYGTLVDQLTEADVSVMSVQEKMGELIQISNPDEELHGYILSAMMKLTAKQTGSLAVDAEDLIRKSVASKSTDLQQRALEIQSFLNGSPEVASAVLPFDASCEDLGGQLEQLQSLSFMDSYVEESLQNGAAAYVPESERDDFKVSLTPAEPDIPAVGLRFDAYQMPTPPQAAADPFPMPEIPVELPAVPVSSFVSEEPVLTLPTGSKRWGPVQAEGPDPPVLQLSNSVRKLEYSQPEERKSETPVGERMNGSAELSERDVMKATLFGEAAPPTAIRTRKLLERGQKSQGGGFSKAVSPPAKKPEPVLDMDLLDLSEPQQPRSTTDQASLDPFAGVDLLSGTNGLAETAPPPPAATARSQPLDLDALYGPTSSTMVNNYPPMHHVPPMMAPGLGLKTGMSASSMPNLAKPTATAKEDPFKDLLG